MRRAGFGSGSSTGRLAQAMVDVLLRLPPEAPPTKERGQKKGSNFALCTPDVSPEPCGTARDSCRLTGSVTTYRRTLPAAGDLRRSIFSQENRE